MSFATLLILLSLIIVVPIFFVIKEKNKREQVNSSHRHKQYLESALVQADLASHAQTAEEQAPRYQSSSLSVIDFTASHPFVQLLYNHAVPNEFQRIMDDIGQYYERIHHEQITQSQLFTLNKLIESRIPELMTDYLSLDADYARQVVIDSHKNATSYDIVLSQLHSILDFTQKVHTQSQSGVVDKLLASQRYLNEVYQDSGMSSDANDELLKIK